MGKFILNIFAFFTYCHLLANLFPSFWLFCVLLWMRWMQVTVHKLCHLPHASRITTCGTIFAEIFSGVSKKWVRSWSHTFLIANVKTLTRKLLAVRQEKGREGKKTRIAVSKLFPLNANAINYFRLTTLVVRFASKLKTQIKWINFTELNWVNAE